MHLRLAFTCCALQLAVAVLATVASLPVPAPVAMQLDRHSPCRPALHSAHEWPLLRDVHTQKHHANLPMQITGKTANCRVGPELSAKYKVQQDNQQLVVSLSNR